MPGTAVPLGVVLGAKGLMPLLPVWFSAMAASLALRDFALFDVPAVLDSSPPAVLPPGLLVVDFGATKGCITFLLGSMVFSSTWPLSVGGGLSW